MTDPENRLVQILARDLAQTLTRQAQSKTECSMFLTEAELDEMTGYHVSKCQKRWLTENEYAFTVTRYGKPRVLRAAVQQRLLERRKGK